jgi:hypothetical protein
VAALQRVLPRAPLFDKTAAVLPFPFFPFPPTTMGQRRGHRNKPPRTRNKPTTAHKQFIRLQVLNTFSSDSTSPTIAIQTQRNTYLFNCPEGTQRTHTIRCKIPREGNMFLTRVNWDVAGGLPGMSVLLRVC